MVGETKACWGILRDLTLGYCRPDRVPCSGRWGMPVPLRLGFGIYGSDTGKSKTDGPG